MKTTLCFRTKDGVVHGVAFMYYRADMLKCEAVSGKRWLVAADLTVVYELPVTCLWCAVL